MKKNHPPPPKKKKKGVKLPKLGPFVLRLSFWVWLPKGFQYKLTKTAVFLGIHDLNPWGNFLDAPPWKHTTLKKFGIFPTQWPGEPTKQPEKEIPCGKSSYLCRFHILFQGCSLHVCNSRFSTIFMSCSIHLMVVSLRACIVAFAVLLMEKVCTVSHEIHKNQVVCPTI